jgi:hypothetical protein
VSQPAAAGSCIGSQRSTAGLQLLRKADDPKAG